MPTYRVPTERTESGALALSASPERSISVTFVQDRHALVEADWPDHPESVEVVDEEPVVDNQPDEDEAEPSEPDFGDLAELSRSELYDIAQDNGWDEAWNTSSKDDMIAFLEDL